MKKLTVTTGGHPLTTDQVNYLQMAIQESIAAALLPLIPAGADRVIMSGCEVTASGAGVAIAAGWVYYAGELYQVKPGSVAFFPVLANAAAALAGSSLKITTQADSRNPVYYSDNTPVDVYQDRWLELQSGTGGEIVMSTLSQVAHADRPGTVKAFYPPSGNLGDYFDATTGLGLNAWRGWALLDGIGGRPDAKKRAIVGYDGSDPLYAMGNPLGEATVTLTEGQTPLPKFNIRIPSASPTSVTDGPDYLSRNDGLNIRSDFPSGAGLSPVAVGPLNQSREDYNAGVAAHNNIPPSLALAWVIKL